MKPIKKNRLLSLLLPFLLAPALQGETRTINLPKPIASATKTAIPNTDQALVQVALLLDTSGSMNGLIDQARYQLWNVVSELSKAERDGRPTSLEIAVYQYGSDLLPKKDGFLRQLIGFTDNLDDVSAALFSLTTDGSEEYCGQVIGAAVNELEWSKREDVYKVAFIAGNESFDQGPVTFGSLLASISERDIILNTIFCGNKQKGDAQWRSAAQLVGGSFTKIDHNHHLPNMETPQDEKMRELNRRMNETFVWFGEGAQEAAKNQAKQDANAQKMSDHAYAARMSAKVGHLYHHVHHDLVDALAHGTVDMSTLPENKMPPMLANMAPEERMSFIAEKTRERKMVRRLMADVITQRHRFLEANMKADPTKAADGTHVLGSALVETIRKQAARRGYTFAQ